MSMLQPKMDCISCTTVDTNAVKEETQQQPSPMEGIMQDNPTLRCEEDDQVLLREQDHSTVREVNVQEVTAL